MRGSSTFGASEANPAYLNIRGKVAMGAVPDFSIGPGEAAKIPTGGMLPIFVLQPQAVAAGVGLIVFMGIMAGLLPAVSAMQLKITDGLRRN